MSELLNWRHKDEWKREGRNFMVVISRHSVGLQPESYEGAQRWCVYAYIYPQHPHFANFSGPHMWQDAANGLYLHGGPSLLRWHYNDNKEPVSVQVGCDYNHLHDDIYTHMETQQDARSVFEDADALFNQLALMHEKAQP